MGEAGLGITADLSDAFDWVLGAAPTAPEPAVVVAACLDALAKGHGLSESLKIYDDPLQRADLPAPARALLQHLFADGGSEIDADTLRNRLYDVFSQLAQDSDARRQVNRKRLLTDVGLLTVGQVYWNLEANSDRPELPIRRQDDADIPVPGVFNKDFATMEWAPRCDQKCSGKSSGQGFRTQGARLAVLAAQFLVGKTTWPLPDLDGAVLRHAPAGQGSPRILSIAWPGDESAATTPVVAPRGLAEGGEDHFLTGADRPGEAQQLGNDVARILVGAPAEVGADYQPRGSDAQIERLWADGGDRRIWLRGGPGLGKSYSARRVMQEALANQDADHDELLIWVDSADAATVTEALSAAADRLRQHGLPVPGGAQDSTEHKARALLALLAISTWRWLIVLDNADAGSLIQADPDLVPPGGNPNGRVLLTTRDQDHRIASHGRVVTAQLFTTEEAEEYLRKGAHLVGRSTGPLVAATPAQTSALAEAVGHHPLALSVAASTIVANAMTVPDWIDEFTTAGEMDTAADEPDKGGYPHLIGATWQVALSRAGQSLPEGVVERAAMVAAIQDPDGHPTWLWDRDPVADWVADGQTLTRRHGMPVAVQRLIGNGIVELRGGTWRGGQVAIHRLAARAVREAADTAARADLAGILLTQWLLELTANPSAAQPDILRRSLRPINALPDLPDPARRTVIALLAYQQRTGTGRKRKLAESLAPHLDRAGTTGRIEKARLTLEIADDYAALGRAEQARTAHIRAAELYRQVIEEDSLDDDELASCLTRLGDIEGLLGNPEQARASRERAAGLLERLSDNVADTATTCSRLSELVELHVLLGNQERKAAALACAEEIVTRSLDDPPSSAADSDVRSHGDTLRALARLMTQAGRTDAARQCLTRESAIYEQSPELWTRNVDDWVGSVQELALLHARTGEWSDAEHLLIRLTHLDQTPWVDSLSEDQALAAERTLRVSRTDTLVLLASVQTHLGRPEGADRSLALAAEQYREHTAEDVVPRGRRAVLSERGGLSDGAKRAHEELLRLEESLEGLDLRLVLHRLAGEAWKRGRRRDAVGLEGSLLDLAQHDADAAPGDTEAELELASMHLSAGFTRSLLGEEDDALSHFTKAVDSLQLLTELDPGREDVRRELAAALEWQAESLAGAGRQQAAADSMARAVSIRRRLADQAPDDREVAMGLAQALGSLGGMHAEFGNPDEAVSCWDEAISIRRRLADQAPDDREVAMGLAQALGSLGGMHAEFGNPDEAVSCWDEAISIRRRLADQAPDDHTAQIALAQAFRGLGEAWLALERPEAAVDPLRRSIDKCLALDACQEADDPQTRSELAKAQGLLGDALDSSSSPEDAIPHYSEAVNALRSVADHAPDNARAQNAVAFALAKLGLVRAREGQYEQAADCLSRSANIAQLLHDLNPGERPDLAIIALEALEVVLRDLGRTDAANEALARASDLAHQYPDEDGEDGQ